MAQHDFSFLDYDAEIAQVLRVPAITRRIMGAFTFCLGFLRLVCGVFRAMPPYKLTRADVLYVDVDLKPISDDNFE